MRRGAGRAVATDDCGARPFRLGRAGRVIGRLAGAAETAIAGAADPEAKAALQGFVDTFAKAMTPEGIDDPAFDTKVDRAAAEAGKHCPALIG